MIAWLKGLKLNREQMMACQEKTEARLEEEKPASIELKPEVPDEEVLLEDAILMPVGEPRNRCRDRRHLAAQRRQKKEQKRPLRKDGCQKNFVAARRAAVAWRRINFFKKILTHGFCALRKEETAVGMRITLCAGHGRKRRNKKIVIEGNRIKRREPKNERSKGTRSRHVEELLHLRKKEENTNSIGGRNRRLQPRLETMRNRINEVFGETNGLWFGKRAAGSPVALRRRKKWALCRGRPPPKRKKKRHWGKKSSRWGSTGHSSYYHPHW
jgi:hypothetical protein